LVFPGFDSSESIQKIYTCIEGKSSEIFLDQERDSDKILEIIRKYLILKRAWWGS